MKSKNMFIFFIILIFLIGTLNFVYADAGSTLGPNQAKHIAQDYLNSHNLPYTAVTPNDNDWKVKVKDTKTGGVKWIPINEYGNDVSGRYEQDQSADSQGYVVQVNDKNGKNVGRIYIGGETNKILKAILDPVPQTNKNTATSTDPTNSTATNSNTTNTTAPTSQGTSGNNTGILFGAIILIVAIGAGYFMYTRI